MQIIPVIDLMQGQVVHAKHGMRGQYQPIQSQLTASHEPLQVVDALLKLYPFDTLYIADIDAILGLPPHTDIIKSICERYPSLNIWLDSGIKQANASALGMSKQIKMIVGSENIAMLQNYHAISDACNKVHSTPILSLDFNQSGAMGIPELHDTAYYWPNTVICMSLTQVGSRQGIDIERLKQLEAMNNVREKPSVMYAAGGLRGVEDAKKLREFGIKGVLVATALHQRKLSRRDIESLSQT